MSQSIVVVQEKDIRNPFSSLSSLYGVRVNGEVIESTEHLFQSLKYAEEPTFQRMILDRPTPNGARWLSRVNTVDKPFISTVRADWNDIQDQVMDLCIRLKLVWNWVSFGSHLRAAGAGEILYVSDSDDTYWGVTEMNDGFQGENRMGKLLMNIRDELTSSSNENLRKVDIPFGLDLRLLGQQISSVDRRHHLRQVGTRSSWVVAHLTGG